MPADGGFGAPHGGKNGSNSSTGVACPEPATLRHDPEEHGRRGLAAFAASERLQRRQGERSAGDGRIRRAANERSACQAALRRSDPFLSLESAGAIGPRAARQAQRWLTGRLGFHGTNALVVSWYSL